MQDPLVDIFGPEVEVPRRPAQSADEAFMRRAMDLAWRAAGKTEPNPMVGAIVVSNGEVVAEGYHDHCGGAHAETSALAAAGEAARGATLFVTLEPCAHYGRTPPCTEAVIESGVTRVVIPALDPDERVVGRGIAALREAGISVEVGCLGPAAILQNIGYYRDKLGLGPTVTLKMAATIDGMIASARGKRDTVTGQRSRERVHAMRASNDCVVVGVETVIVDRPRLDTRLHLVGSAGAPLKQPTPVVLDTNLRTPLDTVWAEERLPYVIVCGEDAPRERREALLDTGATILPVATHDDRLDVAAAVDALAQIGCSRVMVEGGAEVFTSFVKRGAWHGLYLFQSPRMFGEAGVPMYRGEGVQARLVDSSGLEEDAMHALFREDAIEELKPMFEEGA